MKNLLKEDLNKLRYEIQLVNSNFLKEAHDEHSVDLLKKLLIPRENDEDLNYDHSFGIFLGFDVEITDDERKLNNADFRETIYEKVENAVRAILPTINDHIKQDDFRGYSFYIYIVPFSELKKQRKKMIAELKNRWKMTAANQIAQTIISDSYFLKLYRVCVERSVLRTLNIDTEEKYTEKEIRDLLRFADLLSTSSISVRVITHIKSLPI